MSEHQNTVKTVGEVAFDAYLLALQNAEIDSFGNLEDTPDVVMPKNSWESLRFQERLAWEVAANVVSGPFLQKIKDLLDTLEDVLHQACHTYNTPDSQYGVYDSMALTAYANGLTVLIEANRLKIVEQAGRRVIAENFKAMPDETGNTK